MKVKTSELTDAALDRTVAECRGFDGLDEDLWLMRDGIADMPLHAYTPSTDWAQGGPIIERERLSTNYSGYKGRPWYATHPNAGRKAQMDGPTPLIAAMRCYVASRLGDEVDVPDELV